MTITLLVSGTQWTAVGSIATVLTAVVLMATGVLVWLQLRQLNKAGTAQFWWSLVEFLQDEAVRSARATLIGIGEGDYSKWSRDQVREAELVCTRFDIVGRILRAGVVDHSLITQGWQNSIVRSWEHARPLLQAYRKERGDDYFAAFDWLYDKAKAHDVK